jgi:crotonobetainyl-CoA:carnitine CoA-transferase CaiB-like acyl-CoA transferase
VLNERRGFEVTDERGTPSALSGLRVLDCGVLFAGPMLATMLADFGADVIKVEHPRGDPVRSLGWNKDGVSLWWAHVNRNKRYVSLNLSKPRGAALLKELVSQADVVIESFRPGRMEAWGLDYEVLSAINPNLVMVRTSGYGQTGPYSHQPGFGTVAEAMSGYAYINGFPDGPPALPSFALGDGVCALYGAVATLAALRYRDVAGGRGQMIDLSLLEPLFAFLGPQALAYDQLGAVQERNGNSTTWTAPRNTYLTKDGRWVALSASSQSIAERLVRLVGRGDLADEEWFADHAGRAAHAAELDQIIGDWIAKRTMAEALEAFEEAQAAIGPVYSIADIFADPHYQAREAITSVEHPQLGPMKTPNVVPKLSATPGAVRNFGGTLGEHNESIYVDELGHSEEDLERWAKEGVI